MAKGIIGGATDYSHQTFDDILNDLDAEQDNLAFILKDIQRNIENLERISFWSESVPYNFKAIIAYCIRSIETAIQEFQEISNEIEVEVEEHHISRLHKIAYVADDINRRIGIIWHQQYDNKDYNDPNFLIVENIYGDARDMAVGLLDIANLAERLNDFIGKSSNKMKNNNPWLSGSFYLALFVAICTGIAVLSNIVHWYLLPIILISCILLIAIIGILQLKNDDLITDKTFKSIIKEIFKRLPLLSRKKE